MFEVKPVESKEHQRELGRLCGVPYRDECFAYAATEEGKVIGLCQLSIKNDTGYMYELVCPDGTDDEEMLFIMGRATLNFIDLCGAHDAEKCVDDKMARKIGFVEKNGKLKMNLRGVFDGHHHGKNAEKEK